jgi:FkbM family methyltransferase
VDFIDEAVWIENTTLTFHVDDDEENADHGSRYSICSTTTALVALLYAEKHVDLSASLFEDHAMVHEDGIQVEVPAMNFSDFLARNFRPEDTVIVRCDIEGAEYEVLKSLIVTGTARLVDYIDVEWHAMLSPSLHHLKQVLLSALLAGPGLTLRVVQADTVLPWLLEGFGTRVKARSLLFSVCVLLLSATFDAQF